MKKTIIHLNTEEYMLETSFNEDYEIIKEFSEENKIYNIIFYESEKKAPILLNSKYIEVHSYKTKKDLEERVRLINEKDEIIYISTRVDNQIKLINELRILIGQKVTSNIEIFNDKGILRELLENNAKETNIPYLRQKISELDYDKCEKEFGNTFIVKPLSGAAGIGVAKIKSKKNLEKYVTEHKNTFDEVLIEEYIGGVYSIDYYVDSEGNSIISRPLLIKVGNDIDIDSLFILSGTINEETDKDYNKKKIHELITKSIEALGIRNTFINHEYVIDKKGNYRTIEINGRIGERRLSLYKAAYDVNLFSLLLEKDIDFKLRNNISFVRICSDKEGIFEGFNNKELDKIKKLDSTYRVRLDDDKIGGKILSGQNVGVIELMNKSDKKLEKDIEYIYKNYNELLELDKKN